MIEHAVACGLLAAGCEVVRVGILPTPTIQVYVGATHARGGIAITASHNPAEVLQRVAIFLNGLQGSIERQNSLEFDLHGFLSLI